MQLMRHYNISHDRYLILIMIGQFGLAGKTTCCKERQCPFERKANASSWTLENRTTATVHW